MESSAENSPEAVVESQKVGDTPDQPIPGPSDDSAKKPGQWYTYLTFIMIFSSVISFITTIWTIIIFHIRSVYSTLEMYRSLDII